MKDSTLRELAVRATDGPWHYEDGDDYIYDLSGDVVAEGVLPADGLFIAAAHPQAILSLLDRIEKLRAALRFSSGTDWAVIAEEALAADDKAQGA